MNRVVLPEVNVRLARIGLKWDELRQKVINGWTTRRHAQFIKVNSGRERSISILQKRYGYTREQAIYQLDKYYAHAWLG